MEKKKKKTGLKLNIQKTKIMTSSPIISWQIDGGKMERVKDFIFLGFKITVDSDVAMKLKDSCSWKNYDKPIHDIKKQADKGLHSQSYGFSNSCVHM